MRRLPLLVALGSLTLAAFAAPASAQTAPAPTPATLPALTPADTNDVRLSTPDSVIANLYRVISGPAGQVRNWMFFRQLFLPEGRLAVVGRGRGGAVGHRVMTPDEYVQRAGPSLEARGFFERELHREAAHYGHVYHAFSTYDSRAKADDAQPFARGINSIQLVRKQGRWWVFNVLWNDEAGAGEPIPERYRGR